MSARATLTTPNDVIAEIFDAQAIGIMGSSEVMLATRVEGPIRAIHGHGPMAQPRSEHDASPTGTDEIAQLLAQPPRGQSVE